MNIIRKKATKSTNPSTTTSTKVDTLSEDKGKPLAIILSTAAALAMLALIGLYLLDTKSRTTEDAPPLPTRPSAAENQEPESDSARAQVETLQALSPSDTLSSILTDLENTNLDALTSELPIIDAELE